MVGFGLLARQLCLSLPAPKNQAQGARGHPQGSGGASSRFPPLHGPPVGSPWGSRGPWVVAGAPRWCTTRWVCVCVQHCNGAVHAHCSSAVLVHAHTHTPRSDVVLVHAHVHALQRCCACDAHTHTPCSHAVPVRACKQLAARLCPCMHSPAPCWTCVCRHFAVLVHPQAPCSAAVRVRACKHLAVTLCLCMHKHLAVTLCLHANT